MVARKIFGKSNVCFEWDRLTDKHFYLFENLCKVLNNSCGGGDSLIDNKEEAKPDARVNLC